jgi:hypothetical protein
MNLKRISRNVKFLCPLLFTTLFAASLDAFDPPQSSFQKHTLTNLYYADGINAGDLNNDGHVDIVSGPFWYAGPNFKHSHEYYKAVPLLTEKSPSNSMFTFLHDWSGDGWLDVLVLGRVHMHNAFWYENPAKSGNEWKKHFAFERVKGESPMLVDMNEDGQPELLAHWEGEWGFIAANKDKPSEPWKFYGVEHQHDWPQFYHGEGIGDINSDGHADIILTDGWYEQPKNDPFDASWTYHEGRLTEQRGGAQIYVDDIDADGDADIVSSLHGHEWGLSWFEQVQQNENVDAPVTQLGRTIFCEHQLMGTREEEAKYGVAFSQPHALEFQDLNGDGRKDIIIGKRVWAHGPKGDVEPMGTPVIYWFEATDNEAGNVTFKPHLIDNQSGVGTQITIKDVNNDGRPDVLSASKLGAFVFLNQIR